MKKHKKNTRHQKVPQNTKKYKNTTNLRFIDLRFTDLRFINLRFIDLRFINLRFIDLRFINLRFIKNKKCT